MKNSDYTDIEACSVHGFRCTRITHNISRVKNDFNYIVMTCSEGEKQAHLFMSEKDFIEMCTKSDALRKELEKRFVLDSFARR